MQRPGEPRELDLLDVEPESDADARCELRHPLGVGACVRVTRVDRLRERRGGAVARGTVRACRDPLELRELDHVGAIEAHAVLAVLLCPVERAVGEPDQLVAPVALDGEGGETGADCHGTDVVEFQGTDPLDDRVRGRQGRPLVVIHE